MKRRFEMVSFGGKAPSDAVSCDGLCEGAALDLSHWRGNRTPRERKADTSTEMALGAARDGLAHELVVNNHFDADGVLSVWALLEPERALEHAGLLIAAAEAGDFDEWPADERGLWLEAAVRALAEGTADEAASYHQVLPLLGELVVGLESRRELWGKDWDALQAAEARARAGGVSVARVGDVAVLVHGEGMDELPGPVLARLVPEGATRRLLAFPAGDRWRFRYELARHAWAETVQRPAIASVGGERIATSLGPGWAAKGGGMTGVAFTPEPVDADPERIAAAIAFAEQG
jgi:hypothetical protein